MKDRQYEYLRAAKEPNSTLVFGSSGIGSAGHLAFEYLKLVAGINEAAQKNDWELEIPYLMGLIGTRSLTEQIPGILDLVQLAERRIREGQSAYDTLEKIRALPPGSAFAGPAIVAEDETSTYITASFTAHIDASGCIVMDRKDA